MPVKSRFPTIALLAFALGGPVLGADAGDIVRLSPEQVKSMAIAVAPLSGFQATAARRLPAQAVVPPARMEVVSAPLPGLVTAVRVAYGEPVKKGQVLARLQGQPMAELQRDALQARSQAKVADEAQKRDEALFADGIISQARLSATRAAREQAAALLAEKRASLALAGLPEPAADGGRLSGATEVRAPFDGVVLEAPVQAGQRVDGTAPLFKLGRVSPLWLEIQATPAQAAGLAAGDAVGVTGCPRPGRLTLVVPQLNAASQSLLLRAEIEPTEGCLRPFQYVQAQVVPGTRGADGREGAAWSLPVGALARHKGQSWVFAEAPGGFRPVAVRILEESERSVLVSAPLAPETPVAIRGTATLKAAWLGLGAGQ